MKTKWLLMMLVAVGLVAGTAQANMLANPGFEDGAFAAKGEADGWTASYASWTSAWTWFNDSAGAHSGSKYLKLNGWSTGSDNDYYQWLTGDFSTTDTFGVWAKATPGKTADAAVALYWYDSASVKIGGTIHLTPTTVGDQWTYVEWTSAAPAGAVGMYYSLEGLFANGGVNSGGSVNADGGIYYDDAIIVEPFDLKPVRDPSPYIGESVSTGDVVLSWTNADPNLGVAHVYVDVLFGTEPNVTDPGYDMTKVVTAGQDTTTVQVSAPTEGTYYWQVDSYIYGSPIGDPCEGPVWSFNTVPDAAPSVDAGVDMITWSGQPVSLNPTVVDDGASALTYAWTAVPAVGVVFSDPDASVADPNVTIDKSGLLSTIPIANAGFEDPHPSVTFEGDYVWYPYDTSTPIPGWSLYGGSGTDIALWWVSTDPAVDYYGYEGNGAPEGNIVGVGYNGSETAPEAGFAQVLTETLAANTTYTLTVEVGHNNWYGLQAYRVQLLAGGVPEDSQSTITEGTVLAQDDNSLIIPIDTFATSTVTHTSGGVSDPNVGQHLQIRLLVPDNPVSCDVGFDDVKLTANPGVPFPVVHTVTLTLAVSDEGNPTPVTDSMTIDVYDDACKAAIGAGATYDETDIDKNCITDLKDLAALLAEWLVDNALTTPEPK